MNAIRYEIISCDTIGSTILREELVRNAGEPAVCASWSIVGQSVSYDVVYWLNDRAVGIEQGGNPDWFDTIVGDDDTALEDAILRYANNAWSHED